MLALDILVGGEQRLCLFGRNASSPDASYGRLLVRDVPGTVLGVPPDHPKFGFASTHPAA